ncbi:hypothetical protein CJD36_006590 [Flavipsychrobacter stenotrophus]|uniref:Uncharacterized protein n=1 Tax=Flavipsychrobacter stenotrophus TaxID=2077091 RepID=A0A2S7SXJ9_9BACT|nr:hypothetical protein CJD36_006590 [Flavipsychrobacter stenotrophus]
MKVWEEIQNSAHCTLLPGYLNATDLTIFEKQVMMPKVSDVYRKNKNLDFDAEGIGCIIKRIR